MEPVLAGKKLPRIMLAACLLLCMQQLFAQDSSTTSANISLTFPIQDSVKQVVATLTNADSSVPDIDIHFYVKKSFGLLPLEGDFTTTDENGEASVDFPTDLPGDASGNLVVIARVEDDETLGNVETTKTINWGIPVSAKPELVKRSLSASRDNAPWPLTITVTSLVVVVWGIIFYMFFQLVQIKKYGIETEPQ